MTNIRVTVWNEFYHERHAEQVRAIYPEGMHVAIGDGLHQHGIETVRYATLDEPEHGLTEAVLADTDVLIWWGHMRHHEVSDAIVERAALRVLDGMGLIVLHSGHYSKIFRRLMGTSCDLKWREADERERVWCVNPAHPIAEGLPDHFDIPAHEMYGEPFGIPEPDSLVFVNWFQGGNVFRGGSCFFRGRGKVFYFSPGHETYPIYFQPEIRHVIANAVRWAAPTNGPRITIENQKVPLEKLD